MSSRFLPAGRADGDRRKYRHFEKNIGHKYNLPTAGTLLPLTRAKRRNAVCSLVTERKTRVLKFSAVNESIELSVQLISCRTYLRVRVLF